MIRRINLSGGPGCGKSTTAAILFVELKKIYPNLHIDLVQEYIKSWAYENRKPRGWDQYYCFNKQLYREEILLRNGVDLLVTDSPLYLNCAYAIKNNSFGYGGQFTAMQEFEIQYPSMNIFIDRGDKKFVSKGRYESYEESLKMDKYIKLFLSKTLDAKNTYSCKYGDTENLINIVKTCIDRYENNSNKTEFIQAK